MDELYLKGCDTKWKHAYVTEILAMSNEELLEEFVDRTHPDDYDISSNQQVWMAGTSRQLLERKLKEIGFLK